MQHCRPGASAEILHLTPSPILFFVLSNFQLDFRTWWMDVRGVQGQLCGRILFLHRCTLKREGIKKMEVLGMNREKRLSEQAGQVRPPRLSPNQRLACVCISCPATQGAAMQARMRLHLCMLDDRTHKTPSMYRPALECARQGKEREITV